MSGKHYEIRYSIIVYYSISSNLIIRYFKVSYQNYGKIETGAELPPNVTNVEPDVSWKARNNTIYTLYMAGNSCSAFQ